MADESTGAIIRRARQEARLTQGRLAAQLGVHKNTVADWEKDKYFPDRHYHALNKILHISLGGGPVGRGLDSTVPAEVLAVIRKNYPPDRQQEIIEMLEELSGPPAGDRGRTGRGDPDIGRAG